jgi:phage tail-like protein
MRGETLQLDLEAPGIRALLDGVELEAGALRLARVPGDVEELTPTTLGSVLDGPAGIGVDDEGFVYVAEPEHDRVLRVPPCGGEPEELRCLSRLLKRPRGVVVGPREALYVADSGHARVLVVDLATLQLRGVWGRDAEDLVVTSEAGLEEPWDLAADAAGRVYVVDHATRRVERFDPSGGLDTAFRETVDAEPTTPLRPEYVAVALSEGEERLLVCDRTGDARSRILLYGLDGAFDGAGTRRLRALLNEHAPGVLRAPPAAIAGDDAAVVVAETATGGLLRFGLDGRFLGVARGSRPRVAGIAIDAQGRLLLNADSSALTRLAATAPRASGQFRLGPFPAPRGRPTRWRRLAARATLFAGAHVTLYALATNDAGEPPELPPGNADPAPWTRVQADALDGLIGGGPTRFLWIGGRLQSGSGEPVVSGLRVTYGGESWLRHLPAVYARERPEALLEPALELFEAAAADEEQLIDDLPRLFDPYGTPAAGLDWLAALVSLDRESSFDERVLRDAVAEAFAVNGRRGTAEALRDRLRLELGVDTSVSEPRATLWRLDSAPLGFGTGLTASEADGAIVGTTAVLDRSHLQAENERGAATLGDLAGRYCVRVYDSDLRTPSARAVLERIVEHERPLGTEPHVCVIEPRLRVGLQATVGVDAVVGRGDTPLRLGVEGRLGTNASLRDERRQRLIVSDRTRVGRAAAVT